MKKKVEDDLKKMERQIRKVACALEIEQPTTTREGRRAYDRVVRKVHRATRQKGVVLLSPWDKMRKAFRDFLDWEIEV